MAFLPTVTLPGGLAVSRLGFGCSGLMAQLNRAESARLLAAAFDNGITHFDTARMYGYGEAEGVLGEFAQSRRDAVTITSKVGIQPPGKSRLMDVARGVARQVASLHPAVKAALRRRAQAMTSHGCFDVESVRASVATSLRELRTEYLDVLMLHDCTSEDLADPALADCLAQMQADGRVRHFGIASAFAVAARASATHPALARVVQFANSPFQPDMDGADWTAGRAVITHTSLGPHFTGLAARLADDPATASRWSARLGFDATDTGRLAEVFLAAAVAANPGGCVVFSSRRPAAIAANARVLPRPEMWPVLCDLTATLKLRAAA